MGEETRLDGLVRLELGEGDILGDVDDYDRDALAVRWSGVQKLSL
jgi:hypothetical protein